jgi:predicted RNA-binding Zn-ribbon protein involved in translation (DUF1610 family)
MKEQVDPSRVLGSSSHEGPWNPLGSANDGHGRMNDFDTLGFDNSYREAPRSTFGEFGDAASSHSSTAAVSTPYECKHCGNLYSGAYGRGNLARHVRLKHREEVVMYPCEYPDCGREYFHPDARLKHYRKSHNDIPLGDINTEEYPPPSTKLQPSENVDGRVFPHPHESLYVPSQFVFDSTFRC